MVLGGVSYLEEAVEWLDGGVLWASTFIAFVHNHLHGIYPRGRSVSWHLHMEQQVNILGSWHQVGERMNEEAQKASIQGCALWARR